MPTVDVYGERRHQEVMQETWGHLAPTPGEEYAGTVEFALGCFGDLAVISVYFADLPDSPWLYEDLHNWIWSTEPEEGKVYRFEGTYRKGERGSVFDGKRGSVFNGTLHVLDLAACPVVEE